MKRVILLVALVAVLAATAGCNWAPYISNPLPDPTYPLLVNKGAVIPFSVNIGDWNKEDVITCSWTATGGSPTSGTGREFTWTAPSHLGTFTITAAVSDGKITTRQNWTVTINSKDGFESESGWVPNGLWHRQLNNAAIFNAAYPNYVDLPSGDTNGGIPYANNGDYCYWFGNESGAAIMGNYMNAQSGTDTMDSGGTATGASYGTLTSPSINLGNLQNPFLQFASWFEIEGYEPENFDLMRILISVNGGPYVVVGTLNPLMGGNKSFDNVPYTTGGYDTPAYWELRSYNLSDYVGKNIEVRFEFETSDEFRNGFRGWFIDDFEITEGNLVNPLAKALNPVRDFTSKSR